jgi:hypothetical protein
MLCSLLLSTSRFPCCFLFLHSSIQSRVLWRVRFFRSGIKLCASSRIARVGAIGVFDFGLLCLSLLALFNFTLVVMRYSPCFMFHSIVAMFVFQYSMV